MKTPSLILSCSLFLGVTQVDAQLGGDPTTPPNGAPVATMRSLDQIESRTPLVEGAPGVTVESNGGGGYHKSERLLLSYGQHCDYFGKCH